MKKGGIGIEQIAAGYSIEPNDYYLGYDLLWYVLLSLGLKIQ